jgi:uncharacterized protein (TIGR03083 family)
MNASDVLKYGQLTLLGTLEGLPDPAWTEPGACGDWSVKDIVAHLASYELALVDILTGLTGGGPTPTLDRFLADGAAFNDAEVARRAGQSPAETLAELNTAHARVMALIDRVPLEARRQPGILPWYGADYDLEDVIGYMYYGHKREHGAQIAVVRDRLAR